MEITELKNHIRMNQFQPFYIFAGSEWKIQRLYIDKISDTCGKPLRYIDSINDVYNTLQSRSFVTTSCIYVVRDDKELMQNEKVQGNIEKILGNNILILLLSTVDKRLKFYKTYKDTICEFEPLKPEILRKYIDKEIALTDKNCNKLMEVCEYDYGRCLLEIDKIKQFDHEATNSAFEHLLKAGVIYEPPKDAIFDFVDAVLDHKIQLVFELYNNCVAVGEAVMVMLTVLYNNARAVLQVQTCSSSDISRSTGLTSFQIMNAKKHIGEYTSGELAYIMRLCQKCQQGIVMGTMEEEFVMDYILTKIL